MTINIKEPWIKNKIRCQNGYVYIDKAYWDTDKQRSNHKREYIGKYDGKNFIPNKVFYRLKEEYQQTLDEKKSSNKTKDSHLNKCLRQFYGATYLLDQISYKTGIREDLYKCFGSLSKQILSIAYYLVLEEGQAMYRFYKWGLTHKHPYNKDISSQRSSELFGLITEDSKMKYFKHQIQRYGLKEYLIFDTTSISSYSTLIKQVKYGKNKEGDTLPQINLSLLYGEASMLPLCYKKLPGNISDVITIENLLKDIKFLDIKNVKLILDRGFYSEKNINDLIDHKYKFLIGSKTTLKYVNIKLNSIRNDFVTRSNYNSELKLYTKTFNQEWIKNNKEKITLKEQDISNNTNYYLHIYYNDQKATDDKARFNLLLDRLENNLINKKQSSEDEKLYSKYFIINKISENGKKYSFNEDAIREAEKNFGYFVLMSNDIKDSVTALKLYRLKDLIEKSFEDLKGRLSMRRMSVASEENFDGKLFVQFIALQLLSYIKKQMDENSLFSTYTIQSLLDELDIIEYYQYQDMEYHLSEVTEKQRKLYEYMGVPIPT